MNGNKKEEGEKKEKKRISTHRTAEELSVVDCKNGH